MYPEWSTSAEAGGKKNFDYKKRRRKTQFQHCGRDDLLHYTQEKRSSSRGRTGNGGTGFQSLGIQSSYSDLMHFSGNVFATVKKQYHTTIFH